MRRPSASRRVGIFALAIIFILTVLLLRPTPSSSSSTATATTFTKSASEVAASFQQQALKLSTDFIGGWQGYGAPKRIFVVGCGHSGTSLLYRSIGNMRGVRCLKKETALFVKNTGGDDRLRNVLADWDSLAVKGNYRAWVEKTPRHIYYISKMLELDPLPNNTRIIFIHRDGRDVAASFATRYSWEKAISRWVEDNTEVLPYLDAGVALPVKFEDLTSGAGVLRVLRSVADFLELPVVDAELALALLPGTKERQYQEYCTPYASDDEKFADLASSLVDVLAGKEGPGSIKPLAEDLEDGDGDEDNGSGSGGLSELMIEHNAVRTGQMAEAWGEVVSPAKRDWSWEDERYFYGRSDVRQLMKRFGYPDEAAR